MKRLIISLVVVFFTVTVAMASWVTDFEIEAENLGIIPAVGNALTAPETDEDGNVLPPGPGIPQGRVAAIVENGLQLEINAVNLIMALYCNEANEQQIIDAVYYQYDAHDSDENKIRADQLLADGFKKAESECLEKLADTQAYTEIAGVGGSDMLSGGTGSYATPTAP